MTDGSTYEDLGRMMRLVNELKDLRAMHVDDNEGYQEQFKGLLETFFKKPGAITTFSSGEDAMAALKEKNGVRPHVVFLDVKMPNGMSGLELAEQIGKLKNPPIVVMVSGSTEISNMQKAAEYGAAAFVNKTGGLNYLMDALEVVVQKKRLIKQQVTLVLSLEVDEMASAYADAHNMPRSAVYQAAMLEYIKNHSSNESDVR